MPRPADGGPGFVIWLIALVSLVLPWAGGLLIAAGLWRLTHAGRDGLWMLLAGMALIALDVAIDFVWARAVLTQSDHPDLNRRSDQLIGRVFVLVEPIEGGRGKVRCGDTLWDVEGPDLAEGCHVRVVSAEGMTLRVTPV